MIAVTPGISLTVESAVRSSDSRESRDSSSIVTAVIVEKKQ